MRKFLLLLLALLPFLSQADFVLVQDGVPVSSIVLPEKHTREQKYAATELAEFIRRMSGAELKVGADRNVPNPILIGFAKDGLAPTQVRIACDGKSLSLDGGDVEFGPLQAVYAFLRNQGVLWPFMEEMWLEIPQRRTVTAPEGISTPKPFFSRMSMHSFPKDYDRLFHWMAFNGWRYRSANPPGYFAIGEMHARGIRPFFSTHSWGFWSGRKALNEHLEWNPLLDGKRTPPPLSGPPRWTHSQLCIGNAELRKHILANMFDYLAKNPLMNTLPLEANDGGGYCDCEICRAYLEDPNDRVFKFASEMVEAVCKVRPDVLFSIGAYGNHEEPPPFSLPSNLGVAVCHNDRNYAKPMTDPANKVYHDRLVKWATSFPGQVVSREMGHKVFFNGWLHPFDDILAADVRFYADLKLCGLFFEGLFPSPLTEYLRARLAWDPYQDTQALAKEFCNGMYGPAAASMFNYYRLLNQRIAQTGQNLDDIGRIAEYAAPIVKQALALLDSAEKAVADTPRILTRVHWEKEKFMQLARTPRMWFPAKQDFVTEQMREANRLPNGDFEKGMEEINPNTLQYQGQGEFQYSVAEGEAYHGSKAGCITVIRPGWGRFIMDAKNLDKGKKYAVLAAVKTTDGADMVHIWYKPEGKKATLYRLGDTGGEWYRAVFEDIEAEQGSLSVFLTLNTDPKKGRVLFDDVLVIEQDLLPRR
ncbi:MAG: DUF4838 domain-containing protein [Victivallales bacterium]|nr:DUF4838 domain-containing protein [Victivallales bacterium]